MKNEKVEGYLTAISTGYEYEVEFIHNHKMPVHSKVKNIGEFIKDALKHGWKITLMEVE